LLLLAAALAVSSTSPLGAALPAASAAATALVALSPPPVAATAAAAAAAFAAAAQTLLLPLLPPLLPLSSSTRLRQSVYARVVPMAIQANRVLQAHNAKPCSSITASPLVLSTFCEKRKNPKGSGVISTGAATERKSAMSARQRRCV
jgi:hypothetical protein